VNYWQAAHKFAVGDVDLRLILSSQANIGGIVRVYLSKNEVTAYDPLTSREYWHFDWKLDSSSQIDITTPYNHQYNNYLAASGIGGPWWLNIVVISQLRGAVTGVESTSFSDLLIYSKLNRNARSVGLSSAVTSSSLLSAQGRAVGPTVKVGEICGHEVGLYLDGTCYGHNTLVRNARTSQENMSIGDGQMSFVRVDMLMMESGNGIAGSGIGPTADPEHPRIPYFTSGPLDDLKVEATSQNSPLNFWNDLELPKDAVATLAVLYNNPRLVVDWKQYTGEAADQYTNHLQWKGYFDNDTPEYVYLITTTRKWT
jgi:hypothetical protein